MTNIINMYFNYITKRYIMQVKGRKFMKRRINNPYNLTKENVDITMDKVRAIVLNNLYITIVDYSNILMMPGGKVELGKNDKEIVKKLVKLL